MKATGSVFKYGDNIDTDVIIPARYLNSSNPKELALHCMEDIDKEFVNKVKVGDIIVANKNFGCGSSREHAPLAIKSAVLVVLLQKPLQEFFIETRLILDFQLLNVKRQQKVLVQEILWKLILTVG
jgi:3-isopropylmalate dehydratase, small subunit